jgi:hypothetical protein
VDEGMELGLSKDQIAASLKYDLSKMHEILEKGGAFWDWDS